MASVCDHSSINCTLYTANAAFSELQRAEDRIFETTGFQDFSINLSALSVAFSSAFREIGLQGIILSFRSTSWNPAFQADNVFRQPLGRLARSFPMTEMTHCVGAWAIALAQQEPELFADAKQDPLTSVMRSFAGYESLALYSGGGGGAPIHASVWQYMVMSRCSTGMSCWDTALELCSRMRGTTDRALTNCFHAVGHGMVLSSLHQFTNISTQVSKHRIYMPRVQIHQFISISTQVSKWRVSVRYPVIVCFT